MNQEKIGRFIAACRKENGFTKATLAEKLGVTDRDISKWENGKSLPDPSIKLEHDAGYYECPNCGKRYVPTMKAVVLASHKMRDRKMKCPYCNQRAYHKKF